MRKPDFGFDAVNRAAMAALPELLVRWLPNGSLRGHEYVVRNPKRLDRSPGSFKINVRNGRWADFATGDTGGDIISLRAYLDGCSQGDAARRIMREVGL